MQKLNPAQEEGVMQTEGPVLILAGAGSGKTRVLTHRVAYLIKERHVDPWQILAITFTNKAADEMRSRVDQLVSRGASSVWVSTFHSMCVRILRRHIDRLGYDNHFAIYDADDQKTAIKQVLKKLEIDPKMYRERMLMGVISSAKNQMIDAAQFEAENAGDYRSQTIAKVYREYEKTLRQNNALDFDDLLVKTVELFTACPEILESYQERWRYIMVDEYQDTNTVQFYIVQMLASKYRNLCVVGDDDQSIYKFRGADIRNILDFEKHFPEAKVIKLEQNYRSTSAILDAANSIIANNKGRKSKHLWTEQEGGDPVTWITFDTAYEEADYVIHDIESRVRRGAGYDDFAILYRTNAQSRLFEERLVNENIPYKIVGGVNFYSRREIKDVLAYLKTVDNGADDLAVRRIINVPKRGIGAATIERVQMFADSYGVSFMEALERVDEIPGLDRGKKKLGEFVDMIAAFRAFAASNSSVADLIEEVLDVTGYVKELEAEETEEAATRIQNIEELISKAVAFDTDGESISGGDLDDIGAEDAEILETADGEGAPTSEDAPLSLFLADVALIADIDNLKEGDACVVLMTLHGAKGLEFPYVYMVGMEDGLFPSYMTIASDDPAEIEEERRLCYVGVTRAREKLTMSAASARMVNGETRFNPPSRFISELDQSVLDVRGELPRKKYESDMQYPKKETGVGYRGASKRASSVYRMEDLKGSNLMEATEDGLGYGVGDRVSHVKFGEGTVRAIEEGKRDYSVTVDFDNYGEKVMFANFAKLQKIT